MVGSPKYQSSGSHISVNTQANNPREKQKLTSWFQDCHHHLFSPGVHAKFLDWNIPYFGLLSSKLGILDYCWGKFLLFSSVSWCFHKWAKPVLLLWEKDLVTKKRLMQNYLIYLWHAPKRHTNYKIWGKSQFGFLKIVEIKAKSDERQGKTWNIFEKMCVFSPLLISWLYSLNSWRNFTFHRAMPYIYGMGVSQPRFCVLTN